MAAAVTLEELAAHRSKVRSFLLRMTRDEGLADDLVQEALLRAGHALGGLRQDASPDTWLTAIALNLARDHFRASKRKPPTTSLEEADDVPSDDQPERQTLQAEMSACILGYIARLPKRQGEAVLLYHFAGLSHQEMASPLETTEGNARVILHRGLSSLRASLTADCHLNFADEIPCERREPATTRPNEPDHMNAGENHDQT